MIETIKCWKKANFNVYRLEQSDLRENKSEMIRVLRIFYSSDSLKLVSWVNEKSLNDEDCQKSQGFYFSCTAVIGFREKLNDSWKLYPLSNVSATCLETEAAGTRYMNEYFFDKMKSHSEYVYKKSLDEDYGGKVRYDLEKKTIDLGYGDQNSPLVLKEYGYNLQESSFWIKSLLWQKGARIPDLYNFQTSGNVTPNDKNAEIILPQCP